MTVLLELTGVDKTFFTERGPVRAVCRMSMTIGEGEVVSLVGESGSGKSTIANLVLGLEQPDAGRISFRDRAVTDWLGTDSGSYRQAVQAVFQHPFQALDSRKRVGWLVAEPLVIHRRGSSRRRAERVEELMADVHLDPSLVDRYPHQLSGGQAQRVNDRGRARTKMREAIPSHGCRFVPRCPMAIERCSTDEPELEELSQGYSSRCWLAPDLPLDG